MGVAGVRHEQRGEDAKERRLARAVGSDEAEELGAMHGYRHPVQRDRVAESLDHVAHHHRILAGRCTRVRVNWRHDLGAAGDTTVRSAGMPIFSTPLTLGTRTLIAYTRSARSSRVCTGVGVNSAVDEIHVTMPGSAMRRLCPASTLTCTVWPSLIDDNCGSLR